MNIMNIINLPDEIIELILINLSVYELPKQTQVCKQWRSLCPPTIISKSLILDDKISYIKNRKYNIYDIEYKPCINSICKNSNIGYSVIYFPDEIREIIPNAIYDDINDDNGDDEYYGPLDYPIYRYELPSDYLNLFNKLQICHRSPYNKQNLLYCHTCIKEFKILPENSTWGTFNMVV